MPLMIPGTTTTEAWTHGEAELDGVSLHYVEAGAGPLVILLHGFPEFWYSWRHQIPALATAGFHVVAPDLRGYNLSSKPRSLAAYRLDVLTADVAALIHHFGAERATVVGHDWGGAIAWHMPLHFPQLVDRLVVLNAPHPAAFRRELRTLTQLLKSWYIFFFQLPGLPEAWLRADNFAFLERTLPRATFTAEDIRLYKQALGQPGALTAAINYYRAAFRKLPRATVVASKRVSDVPTLLIWGEQDRYLGPRLTEGLEQWVADLRIERFADASHWVQNDAPERVNRLLLDFLQPTMDV